MQFAGIDGELGLELLGSGIPLRLGPIGIAKLVVRAGALWRNFDGLFQLHDRAVVIVHALHCFSRQFVRQYGVRIDRVHFREGLFGELHVDFRE